MGENNNQNDSNAMFNRLKNEISAKAFDGSSLGELNGNLWKNLLEYMKSTDDDNYKHFPMTKFDIFNFNNEDKKTLFQEIAKKIDHNFIQEDDLGEEDSEDLKNDEYTFINDWIILFKEKGYWKEDLEEQINNFNKFISLDNNSNKNETDGSENEEKDESFDPKKDWRENEEITFPIDGKLKMGEKTIDGVTRDVRFRLSDIKNADAGFKDEPPYVRPQYNIDEETFLQVRGDDQNEYALRNDKELQYTRKETEGDNNHFIRLLMPKYLRYVEVEDLNRNFWVISQTLAAIGKYVLEGDTSIEGVCEQIVGEIGQIWENVFYLWLLNIITEAVDEKTDDTHHEVIYLSNDNYSSFLSYNFNEEDFFNENDIRWDKIDKSLEYLKKDYPESNLAILPVIRRNNYRHNYYSKLTYPGIWYYDREQARSYYLKFNNNGFSFDLLGYKEEVYGLTENESEMKYDYVFPLKNKEGVTGLVKPNYEKFVVKKEEGVFSITLEIIFIDFVAELIKKGERKIYWIDINEENITVSENEGEYSTQIEINEREFEQEAAAVEESSCEIEKGFYQGELISILERQSPQGDDENE